MYTNHYVLISLTVFFLFPCIFKGIFNTIRISNIQTDKNQKANSKNLFFL